MIAELAIFPLRWRPREDLALGGRALAERESWILRARDDLGREIYAEAAPLPRHGAQPAPDPGSPLERWARDLLPRAGAIPLDDWSPPANPAARPEAAARWIDRCDARALLPPRAPCPATRFAAETLLLRLAAKRSGLRLGTALGAPARGRVEIAGLILPTRDPALQAATLIAEGYRTLKLKVGMRAIDEDVALVRRVRQIAGEGVALRLDANRAWDPAAALEFARATRGVPIDLVEEPLANPREIPALVARAGWRVALDESLADLRPADLPSICVPDALVLKPTLLGGIAVAIGWWREAARRGIPCILSSAFEGAVGLGALAELALALAPDTPAGLGTARWLPPPDDPRRAPDIAPERGAIELPDADWPAPGDLPRRSA